MKNSFKKRLPRMLLTVAVVTSSLSLPASYADHSLLDQNVTHNLMQSSVLSIDKRSLLAQNSNVMVAQANVPVTIGRPVGNITTSLSKYYISGASDPTTPLLINGVEVSNRSPQGYFGILVDLNAGQNTFVFSQTSSSAICEINQINTSTSPTPMNSIDIVKGSPFPQTQEYRAVGEKVTLSCKAPIGAAVTVTIGETTLPLTPATTENATGALYPTTFSCEYAMPSYAGAAQVVDLGKPIYTVQYNGITKTCTASAHLGVIMNYAPLYAVVSENIINTYKVAINPNGAAYELHRGMIDRVTGMTADCIRLSSGQWVKKSQVQLQNTLSVSPQIVQSQYTMSAKWDTLNLGTNLPLAAISSFNGTVLKLEVPMVGTGPIPELPSNAMIASVTTVATPNTVQYLLTLKPGEKIAGYYVDKTDTGLTLNIRRPAHGTPGDKPLMGLVIMLDPGHGGDLNGALGPLGSLFAEKEINLRSALKLKTQLEQRGATVVMTRTTDVDISLDQRLALSRKIKPDLFISMHANSGADSSDLSKVMGFSLYYREAFTADIAQTIYDRATTTLGRGTMGLKANNFYVNRGTWSPSFLIESGFVSHPTEFEWLTSDEGQQQLTGNIADSISAYFLK